MSNPAHRCLRIHPTDNVAIVVNPGGLPAGTKLEDGLTLTEDIPQGHKVALAPLAAGDAVRRYGVVIGNAVDALPAGSWVNEQRLTLPAAASLKPRRR